MIPDNAENRQKMRAAGEAMLGTSGDVIDALRREFGDDELEIDAFSVELLQEFDEITLECEACGWYCEPGEIDDNQTCDDCRDED